MSIKKIPPSEFKVMKFIWGVNEIVTSKKVVEIMEEKYGWKTTTTLTLLKNLVNKHFLCAEKIDRFTHYTIIVGEEEYKKFETKYFLENIHDNSTESLFNSLKACCSQKNKKGDVSK
ncbi:BlaI/MecI/CopY family transcriptional regulator [Clostridioides sp. ZZV15-6597]|uniref:BlaI/MecI/CopY family transcriptional regulator n=1 Tax=Clostridioides sp. ZZV15-6597 TaxID=2811500 RepID=UPI001D113A06|nr:BlaI/MecI/CopY family transcriptional regulator [Clostridioides sp. ZZV15-6597]